MTPYLRECIIVASTIGDNVILAKNRDRTYKPELEIIRRLVNGVEIAVLHDKLTGWQEGLNAHGIGLVNSALMVGRDENEKKLVAVTGKTSADAPRVLHALSQTSIDAAAHAAATYAGGIKGHTIVADVNRGYVIEQTSNHTRSIAPLDMENVTVRTNHGIVHRDAGYTNGIKYLSSRIRKYSAQHYIDTVKEYHAVARALRTEKHKNSMLNVARDTPDIFTSSQMVLNLSTLEMMVYLFPSKIEKFTGINNQLPDGYIPTIQIKAFTIKNK
jgi:hypothetical protein